MLNVAATRLPSASRMEKWVVLNPSLISGAGPNDALGVALAGGLLVGCAGESGLDSDTDTGPDPDDADAVSGALFMPFLAATLLVMNTRRDWVATPFRNGRLVNLGLVLTVGFFAWTGVRAVLRGLG